MSILKIWKTLFCFAWMPLYFGGDSKSDSSQTSVTTNTNYVTSTDKRIVASDAAVAINGNGNAIDRSTQNVDASDKSTTIYNTTTDYGSVSAALSGMDRVARAAIDLSDHSIGGAIDSLNKTGDNGTRLAMAAFTAAGQQAQMATQQSRDFISFAAQETAKTNAAFSEAKFGPDVAANKSIMMTMLAVVGVVGVAFAMKGH